jgi:hypothetical protein
MSDSHVVVAPARCAHCAHIDVDDVGLVDIVAIAIIIADIALTHVNFTTTSVNTQPNPKRTISCVDERRQCQERL